MSRRSRGLHVDDWFRAAAEEAQAAGVAFELEDHPVRVYPPKGARVTWRVVFYAPDRREHSGGRTVDDLYATVVAALERSQREHQLGFLGRLTLLLLAISLADAFVQNGQRVASILLALALFVVLFINLRDTIRR